MPARSPRPADPPKSPEQAEALLVGAAVMTVTPVLLTDPPQWQSVILQTWQSLLDYRDDAQPPQEQLSVLVKPADLHVVL